VATGARNQFSTSSSSAGFPKDQQPKPIEKKTEHENLFPTARQAGKVEKNEAKGSETKT